MTTGERIRELRKTKGMTQAALAWELGIMPATVSEWERDKNKPRVESAVAMAKIFGVSPADLIDDAPLTVAEARAAFGSDVRAPMYGRISAGVPMEAIEVQDYVWAPPDLLKAHPRGFYLKVDGESMSRILPNGCYAFVDPDAEVSSGDVAALHINGSDAVIKRFHKMTNSVVLQPDSLDPDFTDQIFDYSKEGTETITVIGRVVWHLPPYDAVVRL